jgi:hypothetical protein
MATAIAELRSLQRRAQVLQATVVDDLMPFLHEGNHVTFRRKPDSPSHPSGHPEAVDVATACTDIMALTLTGRLGEIYRPSTSAAAEPFNRAQLDEALRLVVGAPWTSSKLPIDNAFTTAVVLRTLGMVARGDSQRIATFLGWTHPWFPPGQNDPNAGANVSQELTVGQVVDEKFVNGTEDRFTAPESLGVQKYVPKATVAYWFLDGLDLLQLECPAKFWDAIASWASLEFANHLARVAAQNDVMMDPVEMAMAAAVAKQLRRIAERPGFAAREDMLSRHIRDQILIRLA